mgnify:CR=1 FL=1|jgi:hypothetical protein
MGDVVKPRDLHIPAPYQTNKNTTESWAGKEVGVGVIIAMEVVVV